MIKNVLKFVGLGAGIIGAVCTAAEKSFEISDKIKETKLNKETEETEESAE